jgi:hypothetical protein
MALYELQMVRLPATAAGTRFRARVAARLRTAAAGTRLLVNHALGDAGQALVRFAFFLQRLIE